ncbi:MAG: class II aldolase/adducin family protein [Lachnospiraceae bacterium]|nr:class II aldolase/adducin family protein [Lachnospiraceae bacterium]
MQIDKDAIREILLVAKRLDEKQLLNAVEGNISIKRDGLIYVTPSAKNKAFLTEDMIAITDLDGNQVGGSLKATSELRLHVLTYRMREDIGGIVHAHPPYLTAHAVCGMPVETRAYPEMMFKYGRIEVAGYGRPGTDDICRDLGPILEHSNVALLENHGAIALGPDAIEAMNNIEAAEAIAKVLTIARQVGKEKELPMEECRHLLSLHEEQQITFR